MCITDKFYGCIDCRYYLHVTCATTKRSMDHPSHPAHTLEFELSPFYDNGKFYCDACCGTGTSFSLACRKCNYKLHLPCAAIPDTITHPSDSHPLSLCYENPHPDKSSAYCCGLCKGTTVDTSKWFYRCATCNYGGHVGCFIPEKLEVVFSGLQKPAAPAPQPRPNGDLQMQMYASMMLANSLSTSIGGMKI
ncbi:hypothetical protein LUZ61_009505 [Rhynchospora tenuis]|uniref:DC1 domain-containing protein n=1 Tax=Rhynchospora tenuis TaxID=198213 RepID=A0AAD5ZXG9_9POAL|nr:hypothetical protein LUZ61_009505 [Rhynchospora tenuis]